MRKKNKRKTKIVRMGKAPTGEARWGPGKGQATRPHDAQLTAESGPIGLYQIPTFSTFADDGMDPVP